MNIIKRNERKRENYSHVIEFRRNKINWYAEKLRLCYRRNTIPTKSMSNLQKVKRRPETPPADGVK